MMADADIPVGETWIVLALIGWVVLAAIGGAMIGKSADELGRRLREDSALTSGPRPLADRMMLGSRVETAILLLLTVDMVAKPGA